MRTLVDTEAVQRFVAAVTATKLSPLLSEPQNGRMYSYGGVLPGSGDPAVLELPRGVHWLADTSFAMPGASPSRLYIRPAYQVLLLLAMAFVDYPEVPHHRVVITGSFGTGKTSFLSWVFYHLRRLEKPPVVVLDIAGFFGRIDTDGEVTTGVRGSSFQQELADRNTMYLCDASWTEGSLLAGPHIQARTIVTTPPTHSTMTRSLPDTMRTLVLVMPLWTMAELETCRSACYSRTVSQETLLELFHMWGGVVRWTLGTSPQEAKREFARNIQELHFTAVVQIVRNGGLVGVDTDKNGINTNAVGSRLVHMHVDSDSTFQLSGVALCSSLACSLLIGADAKQLQGAHDFIDACDSFVEPREVQLFYQQVQQELTERASNAP